MAKLKIGKIGHTPLTPTDSTKINYFKDLVTAIREPLLVLSKDLRVLSANHSFYKFFKVNNKETLGALIYDLGNRQWDIPALRHLLETILPQKAVFNDYEVEHDFPNIGRRILLLNARRIPGPPKDAQWILLSFEDVTRRMQLERTLQVSEGRFHKAFETAPDGMLLIEKTSGQIVNSNSSAQEALGYSRPAFQKKKLWELGILKDELHFRQTALELEERGSVGLPDLDIPTRRGRHFPADVFLTDRADVFQCNIRDIRARKQAEETIRDLARFPPENPNPVLRIARGGKLLYANAAALVQMADWKMEPGKLAPKVLRGPIGEVFETGTAKTVEIICGERLFSISIEPANKQNDVALYGQDISERKQGEVFLRESELRFNSLFMNMLNGFAYCRMIFENGVPQDFIYLNVNQAFETSTGLKNVTGKKASEVIPGIRESDPGLLEIYGRVALTGTPESFETYVEGLKMWFSISVYSPLKEHFVTVFDVITERKEMENRLRESEIKYRTLVDEVNDGIYMSDDSGVFTFANPALARIYGFETPQALISRKFMDFIAPESITDLDTAQRASMLSGQAPEVINGQLVRQDGTRTFVEIKAVSVLQDGRIVGSHGVVRDVTERKLAEEKLKEERILLRTLIDNLPDQIYFMDVDGRKIIANQADWQASGRNSMEEVIGKTDLEIYPADLANAYWALDRSVIDSGESLINREEPGLDPQGKPVWLLSSKVPLRDGQGKVVGLVGIGRDITERKQREEEIQSRNTELWALYQLSRQLADANDLATVIELVNRQAVELIHTTFAGIVLLDEADLVLQAVYPVRELGQDFGVGTRRSLDFLPVCRKVLETHEPLNLPADGLELGSAERSLLLLDFARSVCLVPLRVGGLGQGASEALGLLILGEARADSHEPFTPEKLRLARSLGDQAATAIRRMLAREQAERRLQQLASLGEIDHAIASVLDLRLSLQMILRYIRELLVVDATDVLVFNETLQSLEYFVGLGFRSRAWEGTSQRLGVGQAGRAALERQVVRIPDLAVSQDTFVHTEIIKAEQLAAYFAVPLINKGNLKGVLEIYHRTPLYPKEEWLDFLNTLAGQAAIAIENIQLIDNLQRSTDELELAYDATIEGWSHALDLRDKETEGHTQRVTELTVRLARRFGLSEKELVQVRWGSLLHDIGKMGVPDGILLKPGPLTVEEWVIMKKHPGLAYEMLEPIHYLRQALDIPYCHHEKWDGSGYPRGLKGQQIPLIARIFAVVDVWDALNSNRPYRQAWPEEETRKLIQTGAGTHFDPKVVETFFQEQG